MRKEVGEQEESCVSSTHQVKYWKTLTVRELLHLLLCVCLASRSDLLNVSYYVQSMRLDMGIKRLVHGQYIPRSSRAY